MPKKTPAKPKALYRRKPPKVGSSRCDDRTAQRAVPTREKDFSHAKIISPSHFQLREDGSIKTIKEHYLDTVGVNGGRLQRPAELVFHDAGHRLWLYHGNCLELLDAIAAIKLNRACVSVELDEAHAKLAIIRADREIVLIWLQHFRVRTEIFVFIKNDLDLFSDSINGSRCMGDVPQIETERIYHETKFVFLSCAEVQRGAVVHTTVDVSLQEAWAKTPNGKKRETTHVVRCETEIFRVADKK